MPASIFLAKLIGPILLAIGIGLSANSAVYRSFAEEFLRSHALIYLSGLMTMAGGIAIVLTHNVWTLDWRIVVTLLGWLMAVGGAVRIIVPQQAASMGQAMFAWPATPTLGGVLMLVLGAVLCFFGYFR